VETDTKLGGTEASAHAAVASTDVSRDISSDVNAVASLGEPTRRRIFEQVRSLAAPVSREDVADAVGISRRTAAFHLDRLAQEGLLVVSFARVSGRSGPGAGRPAKLYQRSAREVSVSLPQRHYDLAGRLLAATVTEAQVSGEPPRDVLERRARAMGRALATAGRGSAGNQSDEAADDAPGGLMDVLERVGYEPWMAAGGITLHNCPFDAIAKEHTELVCGMNLSLLGGVLDGLSRTDVRACLDPGPKRCCVRLES
jgi:predicted ArsR family transcriptional regulator